MKRRLRPPKLTYSNVIATIALFIALSGVAVAAGLPKNSVGPNQIKKGAVNTAKLKNGAVTSAKLSAKSVTAGKLGPAAVTPGNIGNGAITSAKIGAGQVIANSIKNGVVTANKLANNAVTTAKLADGSVTNAKLGSEVAPLLGTLKSGQTLRGTFNFGAEAKVVHTGISFPFPLTNPPAFEPNILDGTGTSAACPGLKGGNQQTPEAAAGQLCVYVRAKTAASGTPTVLWDSGSVNRLGFGLVASFATADAVNQIQGFWAVTAP